MQDLVGVRVVVDSVKDCYGALGLDPRAVGSGAGPLQGLHRDAQVQPLPVAAHDRRRARRASRSRCRSARTRCTGAPSTASPRTGATRSARRPRTSRGSSAWSTGSRTPTTRREFMDTLKIDLEHDEVFVFTPKGKVITLRHRGDAGRLRVRDPHRGRPPVHRCPGQRPAGAARQRARLGGHGRDLHEQGRRRRPEPRLAPVRAHAAGAFEDPSVVLAGATRRRDRQRARRAREGAPQEGLPVQKLAQSPVLSDASPSRCTTPTSTRCTRRSAKATCRRRPSRSGSSASCAAARSSCPSRRSARRAPAPRGPATGGRPRRGPRRRHGATVAVLHAGAGRRDHGVRDDGPRRVGAPHRLRERRVARRSRRNASSRSSGTTTRRRRSSCRSRSRRSTARACCATSRRCCPSTT